MLKNCNPIKQIDKNIWEEQKVLKGNSYRVNLWYRTGVMIILSFVLVMFSDNVYAQKKKHKNKNDEVDLEAQRKAYEFEMTKFWSFGFENYKNKQYADATKHFWKVAEMDTIKKFPRVYRYLGDSYFKLQKPDSAQIVFEMGIKKYPEDAHLHRMVGYILAQKELTDGAISEYETVVKLDSESVNDWKQLALLYAKVDRYDEAISAYEKVLQLDPDDEEARNNVSALYTVTGQSEKATEAKENVREQEPENAQVRYELGIIYFNQGEYEKSIERFKEFLALSPGDVNAMEYVGSAYQRLERYREAITSYKKILKIDPSNKKVMAEISRCYRGLNNFSLARTYARKALAIDNSYGLGWIALGEVYEASAEACVNQKNGKVDFNDKLVYELAYKQYKKALQDLEYRSEAQRHIDYLQGVLPTTEDKFMHKNQTQAKGDCYKWIY
jgi:tetratricopeptide (TPR) repeat protein